MKRIITISVALLAAALTCSQLQAQTKYSDIFEMIRGKVPGVTVGQAGPGQMPNIVIRGIGTNSGQTQPLFIVDGLQTENIASIRPEDVDSIDIIKDGTSAIYGMQGANGVIMITTKSAARQAAAQAEAAKAARAAKKAARKAARKDKSE
ncbi:MAG: TonB-dependent receptor plug domain-containing protein [Bacteroidales bacterium]|nr:TonB-dependent receptor plug domain-containing protein [Bacteroidales bacterium]MBR4479466.1 TonB-dependent receptor plug domain-containing protein [Bacteroidales bacterium]